jgi:hypothetical protein
MEMQTLNRLQQELFLVSLGNDYRVCQDIRLRKSGQSIFSINSKINSSPDVAEKVQE